MELQTKVPIFPGSPGIDYQSELLVLGSCFAEHIGDKLEYFQFRQLRNPWGILYHPEGITKMLRSAKAGDRIQEPDVFYHNERWHYFGAHSALSHPEKEALLQALNDGLEQLSQSMQKATHVLVTLGTAWAYRYQRSGGLVANCHKLPAKEFRKELLTIPSIVQNLEEIRSMFPEHTQLIFTVSPVRHLRDGFIENQRSKAHLLSALHQVAGTHYFPSYEIMMDELRDYRFYDTDMVHPNSLAIDYIWEKFSSTWISNQAHPVMKQVDEIQKGLAHRPFNPDSEAHKKFLSTLHNKIAKLSAAFPHFKF